MHKIFIAQKSYCVCRVLSLATIRSKYYFNFILNRTRSGRELFDHPSYMIMRWITFFHSVTWSRLYINSLRLVFYHVQYLSWCFLKYLVLSVIIVGRLSFYVTVCLSDCHFDLVVGLVPVSHTLFTVRSLHTLLLWRINVYIRVNRLVERNL